MGRDWERLIFFDEIFEMLPMLNRFRAEFADRTEDAAGKLSFMERDVSSY